MANTLGPDTLQRFRIPQDPTMLERMGEELPTASKFVRAVPAALRTAGRFGARLAGTTGRAVAPFAGPAAGALMVGAETLGVADKANDPNATGYDVATRAAEGVGRLGAMGAGAGLGAAAGSAFGPVGTAVGGVVGGTAGYLLPNAIYAARDWWRGRDAAPAKAVPTAAPVTAPTQLAVPNTGAATIRGVESSYGAVPAPANAAFTTPTAADISGTGIPVSGTGGFVNTRTGAVTAIDSRGAPGYGAESGVATTSRADGSVGSYVGALMNQRQAATTQARQLAQQKYQLEYGNRAAQGAHYAAQASNENLRTTAALAHLAKNPGDYAGAAGIASGRMQPQEQNVFLPTMDQGKVDVGNRRTGGVERVTVQPRPTESDIAADMKRINPATKKPFTREEVLGAYRVRGINVGGFGATR